VKQTIALFVFIAAIAIPANSQQTTPTPTPTQAQQQPYVFPTPTERRDRYVKSVVGPFSLLRTGNAIQQTVIYGLDTALHQDTGFRKSTRKGFGPRLADALLENITSRTTTGRRVVSVPRLAGVYSSRIIAYETWYPDRYSYKDGLRSGTKAIATGFALNIVREFVINF
jgi:hypothetical protein